MEKVLKTAYHQVNGELQDNRDVHSVAVRFPVPLIPHPVCTGTHLGGLGVHCSSVKKQESSRLSRAYPIIMWKLKFKDRLRGKLKNIYLFY